MRHILDTRAIYNRNTKKYIRFQLNEWRSQELRKANYTCFISGKQSTKKHSFPIDVHHLEVTYDSILMKAHKELGLTYKELTTDYEPEDLKRLVEKVKELHKNTPTLCLSRNLHEKIHYLYGNNPTLEQIREFKRSYSIRHYKTCNANHKKR